MVKISIVHFGISNEQTMDLFVSSVILAEALGSTDLPFLI